MSALQERTRTYVGMPDAAHAARNQFNHALNHMIFCGEGSDLITQDLLSRTHRSGITTGVTQNDVYRRDKQDLGGNAR